MKNITISDVAKYAGVSKSTVSQFLNKRYEYMSEHTRLKIEQSIQELNYRPNMVARSLSQKTTFTVGIIVANIIHSFSTHIIRAVEFGFNQHGFHTIVCNADDDPEKERNYIEMLMAKQVDAIILFPTGDNINLYQQMQQQNFPILFMDRTIEGLNIPSILLENEQATMMATNVLIENGHERIAIITGPIKHKLTPRIERITGYKKALVKKGISVRDEYIHCVEIEQISKQLDWMFQMKERPQAIIAGNDRVLLEILKYIKQYQLIIPTDIAVIGIDEVPFAEIYAPELTTISQPTELMAQKAIDLLLDKMKDEQLETIHSIIRFSGKLNERQSHKNKH